MTRCVIHIGMHKTGSTSIQRSLHGFENEEFLYATLGKEPNHSLAIHGAFASHPDRHRLHRTKSSEELRAYKDKVFADLDRSISAAGQRTLLISGESISVLPPPDLTKLRDFFRSHFTRLEIVGYVRPPAGYLTSNFQELVKKGSMKFFDPEKMYRNYKASFAKLDQVFGREGVELWKFDPKAFPEGCVVRDFCSRLGIPLPQERIIRSNESLSREMVSLLYTYAKFGEGYGSTAIPGAGGMRMSRWLGVTGHKFRFSPEIVLPVLEKNRSDIEWIEARLGQSMHEELAEYQPGDIRNEQDLLAPNQEMISRLLTLLGNDAPEGVKGETPYEVALLVHTLRERRAAKSRLPAANMSTKHWRRPRTGS